MSRTKDKAMISWRKSWPLSSSVVGGSGLFNPALAVQRKKRCSVRFADRVLRP
jgi:hypothetical protein